MKAAGRAAFGGAAALVAAALSPGVFAASTASSAMPSTAAPGDEDAGETRLDVSQAKLLLAQVVFRHGARTPLTKFTEHWKQDPVWDLCGAPLPYQPVPLSLTSTTGEQNPVSKHNLKQMERKMPGGCFAGELTRLGRTQALELGQQLRQRYIQHLAFLPPQFSADVVSCRTTNFDRTIKSLAGVLTGLYPDHPQDQPIPVVTSSDLDEILYADTKTCPHLQTFLDLSKGKGGRRSSALRDPDYAWARAELQRVLGLGEDFFLRPWAMTDVHDAFTSMRAHGKKMPAGVTEQLLAVVNRLATREFAALVAPSIDNQLGQSVLRLSMGVLLHTLVSNMEAAAATAAAPAGSGTVSEASTAGRPALYLFSGHDSTIIPLLAALGLQLNVWPPYMSNLVFELWELPDGRHMVRVLYNMQELQIPYCKPGQVPSLARFRQDVVGPFVLSAQQWGDACQVRVTHDGAIPKPVSVSSAVDDDE